MSTSILMNRTRTQILRFLIRSGPTTCTVLASELRTSMATIRRHLLMLQSAGLVQDLEGDSFSARAALVESQLMDLAAQFSVQTPPTTAPPLAVD
ncbi:winged helix-turn-helix domain-containing protein [Paenarthrobacter nicotinovorans]|uniref:winged helix-turn-helix domain-containing protein n=1 Tax=Paenarthrobacter nicotinovorans TaxID=29320 RepID=UPI003DA5A040